MNAKTVARIMDGHSCAELETVINEAGLYAGYERSEFITMEHLLEACLRIIFDVPADGEEQEDFSTNLWDSQWNTSKIVYHEAGHAVISELLCPESVTLVSAYDRQGKPGGFTAYYNDRSHDLLHWRKSRIVAGLGGIAANENRYGVFDIGGSRDLNQTFERTKDLIVNCCINGFGLYSFGYGEDSEEMKSKQEHVITSEVEKYYRKAKEILTANAEYFEKVATELARKKLLSAVDMQELKRGCKIIPVAL